MLGTIVNTVAVIVGAIIGMIVKRGLPEKMADTLMKGLGLCTLFLGISGSLKGQNSLILIISMVVGTLIGEGVDLEGKLNALGNWCFVFGNICIYLSRCYYSVSTVDITFLD